LFGCARNTELLAYHDLTTGQRRFAHFDGNRLVGALFLAAKPVAVSRDWAVEQLDVGFADRRRRLAVIAGRPSQGLLDRGAIVCSCFGVGSKQIATAARSGCHSVEAIGARLQAGTNCGSCRSEIKEIIDAHDLEPAE
jgi:assimilatory nitrate reductase catalytic subunit